MIVFARCDEIEAAAVRGMARYRRAHGSNIEHSVSAAYRPEARVRPFALPAEITLARDYHCDCPQYRRQRAYDSFNVL